MACSYAFGVSGAMSAFTVAFQVPNLFRRLFGEGALSAAAIPVLSEKLEREDVASVDALAGRLVAMLLVALAVLCIVLEGAIAGIYWCTAARGGDTLVWTLTALMLPYMVLICGTAILGGIQNVFGGFAVPAALPIVLNIFNITAALTARRWFGDHLERGVVLLSASVMVAGMVQFVLQWFATRRRGLKLKLKLDTRDPAIRRNGLTMLPMLAGLAAVQLNTLADSVIAYVFVEEQIGDAASAERVGSAVLYFGQRLYQFPLGVFSAALATAIFPTLSRYAAVGDKPALGHTLSRAVGLATFEGVPCMVGLILVREPLVEVLFKRGEFAAWGDAVDRVSFAVAMYAVGIWAASLNQIVVRAFYSVQDVRTPLRISMFNVVLNVTLNLILVNTFMKEAGMAFATSFCATLQIIWLMVNFHRRQGHLEWRAISIGMVKVLIAAALMAGAILLIDKQLLTHAAASTKLLTLVPVGAAIYLAATWMLKCEELRHLLRR